MKKHLVCTAIAAALTLATACGPGPEKQADELIKGMSMDRKIGQMLMAGVPGNSMSPAAADIIKRSMPGGVIFFAYNISTIEKMSSFIDAMQRESMESSGIPLFVSIDQEGGRVKRITDGITQFPGNMAMGVANDEDLTYKAARILGMELRLSGINMNLAPDVDVNNNPLNPVINTRSFGASVPVVVSLGKRYIRGLQKSRCVAVAKHFPGHGDTHKDSHKTLPVIHYGRDRLERVELPPFREAIRSGVAGVMTAHISYPLILGSDDPATLSPYFLSDVLRKELRFNGVVISDDMEMDAISKRMKLDDAAVRSVLAGSDIILVSSNGSSIPVIINGLKKAIRAGVITEQRINDSVRRILTVKLRFEIMSKTEYGMERAQIKYRDSQMKLMGRADEVNRELSRKAVCYTGPGTLPVSAAWADYDTVGFVSGNPRFLDLARASFGNRVQTYAPAGIGAGPQAKGRALLYYHVDLVNRETMAALIKIRRDNNAELVVLSTGNPYPLLLMKDRPAVLFSLSNTTESMTQVMRCVNGAFSPKTDYRKILGIQ